MRLGILMKLKFSSYFYPVTKKTYIMTKLVLPLLFILFFQSTNAQFLADNQNVTQHKGLFNFHYDNKADKVYLEVEHLDREFLYVNALSEGLGSNDIGLDRGQLGNGVVVFFQRAGNKLLLVQPNQRYRAITKNEKERNSIEEAFAKSVLYGFEIQEEKGNVLLIDITDFLIRDAHGVAEKLKRADQGSYSLDKSRSAMHMNRTKAFPKNVEFDATLTFTGQPKGREIYSVSPDAGSVSVHQHHSFVELPDETYAPRVFDARSGGYPMTYMDYATPVNEPIVKKFIYRHRLEKKDPTAAVSEAKEPIIYYLDPGTPEPVRSALLEGASWWNQAFEAAGFLNAFQVKILPDDADPLDLRYNVIQWVHRSTRGWSYGSSISDPRTGEIIKGHVSLGSLRIRQDFLIAQALQAPYANNETNDQFAMEMALARIRQLSAHEVGHTLGFAHNFAASTQNRSSVMDYPHPLITVAGDRLDFSNAYTTGIGDWDKITVTYAYGEFPENEAENLQRVLDDAYSKGFRYISDSDARAPGGAHAYAHLWDNGNDIVKELDNVLEVRKFAINRFSLDNIKKYDAYTSLEDVFVPLYFYHRYQTEAVSKMIGGLDYAYAVKGDAPLAVKQLDPSEQRRALEALMKTVDVQNLKIPSQVLELFPPRAMGYRRSRESFKSKLGVAFDPFGAAATASDLTFSFILHPERASRLIANKSMNDKQLDLDEVFDVLFEHSFKKTHKNDQDTQLQQVVNEQLLNNICHLLVSDEIYPQVKASGFKKLKELLTYLENNKAKGAQGEMDVYWAETIRKFIKNPSTKDTKAAPKIPDGSPIGMD